MKVPTKKVNMFVRLIDINYFCILQILLK